MPSALRFLERGAERDRRQAEWEWLSAPKGRGTFGREVDDEIMSGWMLDLRKMGLEILG